MRFFALILLALSVAAPVAAQGNATTNETTNETPVANETPTNETTQPAPTEPAGPITITLETHTEGGSGYFTLEGQTAKNPRLSVQPGQQVTIVLKGTDAGVHNFCYGDAKTCTAFVTSAGDEGTLTFTAPESGSVEYFCSPHRGAGMKSTVVVGADTGAGDSGGEDTGGAISGETIDLGQYSAACAGKVAPAAAAEGIVGMPTLQDYIDACTPSDGPVARAKSGADLVIPISWGLIFVGIAGVVWVHKYYKP